MTTVGKVSSRSWEFEWSIDNFLSYTTESTCYVSPKFLVHDSAWYLRIHPNGETHDIKDYISLYVMRDEFEEMGFQYTFRMGIRTVKNSIEHENTGCRPFNRHKEWGWAQFLKRTQLTQKKSELIPCGILTITCCVKINDSVLDLELSHRYLAKDFKTLFMSKDCSDANLRVKKDEFAVHRSILIARSPVFAAMFRNETKEKQTGIVDIVDFDPTDFSVFLEFLYTGEVHFKKCNVCELYRISHKYDVTQLQLLCVDYMVENLSIENFCEILTLSHQFEENELIDKNQIFFNKNFEKIVSSDCWESFLSTNFHLANTLLKGMAPKIKILE